MQGVDISKVEVGSRRHDDYVEPLGGLTEILDFNGAKDERADLRYQG